MFKSALSSLFDAASSLNKENIAELLRDRPYPVMCDLGCADGELTCEIARAAKSSAMYGIEIVPVQAQAATSRGIRVSIADLNQALPVWGQLLRPRACKSGYRAS